MNRSNLIRLFGLLTCIATALPAVDAEAAHWRHRRRCCEPVCCEPVCCPPVCCEPVRYETVCCEPVRCAPACETVCAPATVTCVDNGCRTCCSTSSRVIWHETVVVPTIGCCASTTAAAPAADIAAAPRGTKATVTSLSR